MKLQEREDVRKELTTNRMLTNSLGNINKGKKFLDYAISRAKVALMRDSMGKVKANSSTLKSIKTSIRKYNLRRYGCIK